MPCLIEYIDAIARQKGRDVLLIKFDKQWQRDTKRDKVIAWLDEQGIQWKPCQGYIAKENEITSYDGSLYIDVPFDREHPQYKQLAAYLEYPDETPRDEGVRFHYIPLEDAMKNAHHDEPGFWEEWAENF